MEICLKKEKVNLNFCTILYRSISGLYFIKIKILILRKKERLIFDLYENFNFEEKGETTLWHLKIGL